MNTILDLNTELNEAESMERESVKTGENPTENTPERPVRESIKTPLENLKLIPLEQIDAGERLRGVDGDWVEFIAASIQAEGLRTPLEVRKKGSGYVLVSGAHRLTALRQIGVEAVHCIVQNVDALNAKLLEIDENLCRRELSALDRAVFLAERKAVYEKLYPQAKHGGNRRSDQEDNLVHLIQSFSKETADKLGLDARTIRRSITRYSRILPDVREKIANTWLAQSGKQLDLLAKSDPVLQRQIADYVLAHPDVQHVGEITSILRNLPKAEPLEPYDRLLIIWNKLQKKDQNRFIAFLAPQLPGFAEPEPSERKPRLARKQVTQWGEDDED